MNIPHPRPVLSALAAAGVLAAGLAASAGAATSHLATHHAATGLPATMTGTTIPVQSGTLARGTTVKSGAAFGTRVLRSATDGVALASDAQDADYAAFTTNGGTTWKIASPALFTATADAPNAVSAVGVAGPKSAFAYGPSCIDVTSNGGATWYRVYPQGYVTSVVDGLHGIAAYVQVQNAKGAVTATDQYVSTDGGKTWKLSTQLGG